VGESAALVATPAEKQEIKNKTTVSPAVVGTASDDVLLGKGKKRVVLLLQEL
jgi:hypothetical protein